MLGTTEDTVLKDVWASTEELFFWAKQIQIIKTE